MNHVPAPHPPGTGRTAPATRPPNMQPCPGCGEMIERQRISCAPCWLLIPGDVKRAFSDTASGTTERKRVVATMREILRTGEGVEHRDR